MSSIDYLILGIIVVSAAIGVWRGFVREVLSLFVWLAAFWFAFAWSATVDVYLVNLIDEQGLRLAVAFVVLFLAVHVVGFVIARLMATVIKSIGLKGVDRVAGAGFGLLRGFVVVAVMVLLIEMTPLAQETIWQQSYMVSMFNNALQWFEQYYPLDKIGDVFVATGDDLF